MKKIILSLVAFAVVAAIGGGGVCAYRIYRAYQLKKAEEARLARLRAEELARREREAREREAREREARERAERERAARERAERERAIRERARAREKVLVRELEEKVSNIRDLAVQLYRNPSKPTVMKQLEELNQLAVEVHRSYPQLPIVKILRYVRMIGFMRGNRRVIDDVRLHKFVIGGVDYGDDCKLCGGTGLCPACYGSGICTLCAGTGSLRNPQGGTDSCRTDCKICSGHPLSQICHRCKGVGALCNYTKLQSARRRMERELSHLGLPESARYDYLGTLYYEARDGMPRDLRRARELFEQAAENGDPHAMYMLSVMLRKGEGGKADAERSDELLLRAANLEQPDSMREMATRGMIKRQYRQVKKWIYHLANPRYLGLHNGEPAARSVSMARIAAFEYRNGTDYMDSDVLVDYPQTTRNAFILAAKQGDLLAREWLLCDNYQNDEYRVNSEFYSHLERVKYRYTWKNRIITDCYKGRKDSASPNRIVCIENFFIALGYLIDRFPVVEFPKYEQYKNKGNPDSSARNISDFFDFFCSASGNTWHKTNYRYLMLNKSYVRVPDGYIILQGKLAKQLKQGEVLHFTENGSRHYFFMELLMLCNFIDAEGDNYDFSGIIDIKELMVVREYGLWTIKAGMAIEAAEKRIEDEKAKEAPDEEAIKRDQKLIREQKTIIDVCRVNANEVWIALHRKLKGEARVFSVDELETR